MKRVLAAAALSGWSVMGMAGSIDGVNNLTQPQFEDLSKDLAAALSYKAGASAAPLGVTGFDVGASLSVTELHHDAVWDKAVSGGMNRLVVPKLYLQKGLPFDIDVGAYYTAVPNSNIKAWGAELKYAILDGGMTMPAVAVRASMTALSGVDQLKQGTHAVDLSISKGILMFTPYAGVGRVWSTTTPEGNAAGLLSEVSLSENRTFIGLSFHPGVVNMALERDAVGGIASYNIKFGVAF